MKFSIIKVTSDDECSRYLATFHVPEFSFYCNDADREMMINALYMEKKPHPQRAPKGCPALGCKTCEECVTRNKRKDD